MEETNKKTFSIKNLLKESLAIYKKQWSVLILAFIFTLAVIILSSFILDKIAYLNNGGRLIITLDSIFSFLVQAYLGAGILIIYLKAVRNQNPSLGDFKNPFGYMDRFGWFILLSLITSALTFVGYVLLIVPGIILTIGLIFASYLFIDKKQSLLESIKNSWKLVDGYKWKMFLMFVVLVLLNIFGLLALGVGLLVTVPISYLTITLLYTKLSDEIINQEILQESEIEKVQLGSNVEGENFKINNDISNSENIENK